jgi:hypothetical protein
MPIELPSSLKSLGSSPSPLNALRLRSVIDAGDRPPAAQVIDKRAKDCNRPRILCTPPLVFSRTGQLGVISA